VSFGEWQTLHFHSSQPQHLKNRCCAADDFTVDPNSLSPAWLEILAIAVLASESNNHKKLGVHKTDSDTPPPVEADASHRVDLLRSNLQIPRLRRILLG